MMLNISLMRMKEMRIQQHQKMNAKLAKLKSSERATENFTMS